MAAVGKVGIVLFWTLVAIAIFSRLVTAKEVPDLIRNGTTAVQRLFSGSFGF